MSSAVRPHLPAAAAIAAVTALQLWLAGAVLEPRTFFSGDAGVKYLQAHALAASGWRSAAVPSPGDRYDPDGRFSMLRGNQFARAAPGAPAYGAYSWLFTLPVSVLLAWGGLRAMYLVPILATTATMLLAYRLALPEAGRSAWLAALLTGLASPMLFYGVDLWEHTLAVSLSTAALLLALGASADGGRRRFAAAGLCLGAAIAVREEILAMLPAALVVLAAVPRQRRLGAAAAAAAGVLAVLLPHALSRWSQTGLLARTAVLRVAGVVPSLPADEPAPVSLALLVPTSAPALLGLAALLAARAALPYAEAVRRGPVLVALCAGAVAWAGADALILAWRWGRPDALVSAFPAVLALLLAPPEGGAGGAGRRTRMLLGVATVFVAGICLGLPLAIHSLGGSQWGPRFLLPACPLLAAAIAAAAARRHAWSRAGRHAVRLVAATLAALTLCSVAVQLQGVRDLERSKRRYAALLDAMAAVEPGELIVTDVQWLGSIAGVVAAERPVLQVNGRRTGSLAELLGVLADRGVRRLTLVAATSSEPGVADALLRAGWRPAGPRTVLPIWRELALTPYAVPLEGDPSSPPAGDVRRRGGGGAAEAAPASSSAAGAYSM